MQRTDAYHGGMFGHVSGSMGLAANEVQLGYYGLLRGVQHHILSPKTELSGIESCYSLGCLGGVEFKEGRLMGRKTQVEEREMSVLVINNCGCSIVEKVSQGFKYPRKLSNSSKRKSLKKLFYICILHFR